MTCLTKNKNNDDKNDNIEILQEKEIRALSVRVLLAYSQKLWFKSIT